MKPRWYKLDSNNNPIPCTIDEVDWKGRWFLKDKIGDAEVSTVFLALDHQFSNGPPILFETMIFGGDHDQEMERCYTQAEAKEQHQRWVNKLKKEQEWPRKLLSKLRRSRKRRASYSS